VAAGVQDNLMDVKAITGIKNRLEFHEAFQSSMSGAHETLRALWHFEKGQNLPKSYLVEFHPSDAHAHQHDWDSTAVRSSLSEAAKEYGGSLRTTEDDSLFLLGHQENGHDADFVVDCLNPRFLVFHTLSNVEHSDRFIVEQLTRYRPEFDLFWFPVSMMERAEGRERIVGWEARFDPLVDIDAPEGCTQESGTTVEVAALDDLDDTTAELPAQLLHRPRVNIDLEYPDALKTYRQLKNTALLPDVPLNAIVAERHDEDVTRYARARITSNGKITGRGPDFPSYLQIVDGTLDDYSTIIQGLESRFWMKLDAREDDESLAISVAGEPFSIKFSRAINVERLLNLMFTCRRPFRLMGDIDKLGDDYYSVEAIDLHVNQPLGFEITPSFMRIYLYEGTCGNTLVRIIRSLQHHVDSNLQHPDLV
jgi:hypothetical protein